MLNNSPKDLKTLAYVLRRTNYGEADRILNLITPEGKVSAMAKGIRKANSKLAGAVEMFTLSEMNLHFGKSDLATLTGAKMIKFHSGILKDLGRMEKASEFLKEVNRAAEMVDSPEFFEILDKSLTALGSGMDQTMVESWFLLNLARAMGEQINLYVDVDGEKLDADLVYFWNEQEMGLEVSERGMIGAEMIKLLRLMWTTDLEVVWRVKNNEKYAAEILKIAQAVKKVVK